MYNLLRDAESYSVSGDEEACKSILTILRNRIGEYNEVGCPLSSSEAVFFVSADLYFEAKLNTPIAMVDVHEGFAQLLVQLSTITLRRRLIKWCASRGYVLNPALEGFSTLPCRYHKFNRLVKHEDGRVKEFLYISNQ